MLSTCFFPNVSSVLDEKDDCEDANVENKNVNVDVDGTYTIHDNDDAIDDDVAQDLRDESSVQEEAEKRGPTSTNRGIIGDLSVFRDFFLAAFSDGYYKVSCCLLKLP